MKTKEVDFRGEEVDVMWVKGSGSDLATMRTKNFTALRLDDVRPLLDREEMSDEEMVSYLSHCMIDHSHPRASIETLLHAFLPFKHVDHTHPDAIISLCCAENGRELAEELFGNRYVWVPYIRPGFTLSKMIAEGVAANPQAELVLMEKHGLVVWGETAKESYDKTISVINEAEKFIAEKRADQAVFGGEKYSSLAKQTRESLLAKVMPIIRGSVTYEGTPMILTYDDSDATLEFVNSQDANTLSQVGAACPDHLVHTKRIPLYVEWSPSEDDVEGLIEAIKVGVMNYQKSISLILNGITMMEIKCLNRPHGYCLFLALA